MGGTFIEVFSIDESLCVNNTQIEFATEFNFFYDAITFYKELIQQTSIRKKSHFSKDDGAIFLLNVRIITSLLCANSLIKRGYYNESMVIQRSVYESLNLCKYFRKIPNSATKWFNGKQISPSTVSEALKIDKDFKDVYGVLCDRTHPNFASTIDLIRFQERNPENNSLQITAHLGPTFDKNQTYTSIMAQFLFLQMGIDEFIDFSQNQNLIEVNDKNRKQQKILREKLFDFMQMWRNFQNE